MARQRGGFDRAKREAILAATLDVLSEFWPRGSLAKIATRAKASRQTLYNQFHSKSEVVSALLSEAFDELSPPNIPLTAEDPEDALAAYAESLMWHVLQPRHAQLARVMLLNLRTDPSEASPPSMVSFATAKQSLVKYFLSLSERRGAACVDPTFAADLFIDLVTAGPRLLTLSSANPVVERQDVGRRARACARLFVTGHLGQAPSRPSQIAMTARIMRPTASIAAAQRLRRRPLRLQAGLAARVVSTGQFPSFTPADGHQALSAARPALISRVRN